MMQYVIENHVKICKIHLCILHASHVSKADPQRLAPRLLASSICVCVTCPGATVGPVDTGVPRPVRWGPASTTCRRYVRSTPRPYERMVRSPPEFLGRRPISREVPVGRLTFGEEFYAKLFAPLQRPPLS